MNTVWLENGRNIKGAYIKWFIYLITIENAFFKAAYNLSSVSLQ